MLLLALVFVGLLLAFAELGFQSRSDSRRQAEQRFDGEATLAASFTSSLLQTLLASSEGTAAKTLGGPTVSQATLDGLAKSGNLVYLLVLDGKGRVIARSSGPAAAARARQVGVPVQVRRALAGKPWLSDILSVPTAPGGHAIEFAVPFTVGSGQRIEVEALVPGVLSTFFGSYLAQAQKSGGGAAFILDDRHRVVGDGSGTIAPGGLPKATGLVEQLSSGKSSGFYNYSGAERYVTASPVDGTTWQVVLTVTTNGLFPSLAGSDEWILYAVLAAFLAAGIVSLGLFRRALISGTAFRQANADLRTLNATLEERVAERTAAAEERATELARSNAELEQFSSIASHDLQEPLRKIRMFGDRLRERLGDGLAAEPAEDLERIESAAMRMQRLINDLLEFSRVSYRGNPFEPVDLGVVATEVTSDLEARILELDARVEISPLPVIEADKTQMRQLIQNLLGNALKFHRGGVPPVVRIGGEVIAAHEPRFPGESPTSERCVITVTDNGIGFEQKHAERVFSAFERLNGRSAYEGTGIGLSIVRKIVWRHGGHIVASAVPGEGATFTVTVPTVQSRPSNGNHEGGEE